MPKRVGEDLYVPPHLHNGTLLRLAAPGSTTNVGMSWTPIEMEPYVLESKGWSTDPGFSPPTEGLYMYFLAFTLSVPGLGTLRTTVSDDTGLDYAIPQVIRATDDGQAAYVRHSGVATLSRFPARPFIVCDEHACQVRITDFRLDLVRLGGFK